MKTTTDIKRGEQALELWKELFAKEIPFGNGEYCHFCGAFSGDRIPKIHTPGCIYMDAMALVQDAERDE